MLQMLMFDSIAEQRFHLDLELKKQLPKLPNHISKSVTNIVSNTIFMAIFVVCEVIL